MQKKFVLCIRTGGSEDLEQRKVYRILPDRPAGRDGYVRVVDESGEDYLYPAEYFVQVTLPAAVARDLEGAGVGQRPANRALQPTSRLTRSVGLATRAHAARG